MAHRSNGVAHPLIANEIGAATVIAAPMQPGIVAAAAQNDRFKFAHASVTEQWKLQRGHAVFSLEQQAKRMFGTFFGPPIPAALNADAAIDLEAAPAIGINQFHGRWPPPLGSGIFWVRVN